MRLNKVLSHTKTVYNILRSIEDVGNILLTEKELILETFIHIAQDCLGEEFVQRQLALLKVWKLKANIYENWKCSGE